MSFLKENKHPNQAYVRILGEQENLSGTVSQGHINLQYFNCRHFQQPRRKPPVQIIDIDLSASHQEK